MKFDALYWLYMEVAHSYISIVYNCQAIYKNYLGQKIIAAKRNFNWEASSKVENNTIQLSCQILKSKVI